MTTPTNRPVRAFLLRQLGWAMGLPAAVFALAAGAGLGAHALAVMMLSMTFLTALIAPGFARTVSGVSPTVPTANARAQAFAGAAVGLAGPALGMAIAYLILGGKHGGLALLWFAGLMAGWFGAASLLQGFGLGAAARVIVLNGINAAACSAFLWCEGMLAAAAPEHRATLVQWIASANPLLTAADGFFGWDMVTSPVLYFRQMSPLEEWTGQYHYASPVAIAGLGGAAFACAFIAACLPRRK